MRKKNTAPRPTKQKKSSVARFFQQPARKPLLSELQQNVKLLPSTARALRFRSEFPSNAEQSPNDSVQMVRLRGGEKMTVKDDIFCLSRARQQTWANCNPNPRNRQVNVCTRERWNESAHRMPSKKKFADARPTSGLGRCWN